MLSFLQPVCDQIAQETFNEACEWATTNPAIAIGATVLSGLTLAAGGLFWSRNHHVLQNTQSAVASTTTTIPRVRESVLDTISKAQLDLKNLPELAKGQAVAEKMPVQVIVNAYLDQQSKSQNIPKIALIRRLFSGLQNQAEINCKVLETLGLPTDGELPLSFEGRKHYNQVLEALALNHLKLETSQLRIVY